MSKFEVRCPECNELYLMDQEIVPSGGGEVPCLNCGGLIPISLPEEKTAEPDPVTAAPAASSEEIVCPRCQLHFVPRAALENEPVSKRRTVLVVEDMEYFQEIAKDALGELYEVKTADSAVEALRVLRQGGIDLLVLDLNLEHTEDGLGLLTRLQPKPCPILIFTAEDEADMYGDRWETLQRYGADDLVIKGMNVGEMLSKKVGDLFGIGAEEKAHG